MDTQMIAHDTQIVNRPARLVDALAASRLQAAQDATRYHGYDNAEGLDPLDDQTAWSESRGYYRIDQAAQVTDSAGASGEVMLTSYALMPTPMGRALVAALRELQPGTNDPGIAAVTANGDTIRLARRPNLYYGIRQIDTRLHMHGGITTADDCRRALNHLTGRGVVETIVVREAYGQTHARLAYRLSPRISVAELNTLIGDTPHA